MKTRLVFPAVILVLCACGTARIRKLPVPQESVIQSYRLMGEGDKLLVEDKTHLALLKYLEASRLNPYHEVIFNKLAIAYSRLHQFYQAEQAAERSIGLNPDYPFAYNTRGIIYLAERNDKEAIKSFQKAIDLRPEEANFHVNLGYTHLRRGNYDDSLRSYRRALELDPEILDNSDVIELPQTSEQGPDSERLYLLARVFAELGNRDSSLNYLGKALSAGFSDWDRLMRDPAFNSLRQDPEFIRLVGLYRRNTGDS